MNKHTIYKKKNKFNNNNDNNNKNLVHRFGSQNAIGNIVFNWSYFMLNEKWTAEAGKSCKKSNFQWLEES